METVQMIKRVLRLTEENKILAMVKHKALTSITSSKTTKAVPLVFGSFPIRI